jgi:hypothetical protein
MIQAGTPIIDIQKVACIEPGNGVVELTFQRGGKAVLRADHPDYEIILLEANRSLRYGRPVGFLLESSGRVMELQCAIDTHVQNVKDSDEDPSRLEVWFWGYSPVCYLTRDHPDFQRIQATLLEAVSSQSMVWLAPSTWPVEGETEIWTKIMDVRPMTPATASELNGTA